MVAALESVPKHIAIVMDGNGRWANKRFLPRIEAHNQSHRTRPSREFSQRVRPSTLAEDSSQESLSNSSPELPLQTDLSLSHTLGVRVPYTLAGHTELPPDGSFEH